MIKYKKPISIAKKFLYGGAIAISPSYADDMLLGLSLLGETIGSTVGLTLLRVGAKATPIIRTASKVAGPLGIASMILTPAQTNVGEDEWMRKLRSADFIANPAISESTEKIDSDTSSTNSPLLWKSKRRRKKYRTSDEEESPSKDKTPAEEKSLGNTLKRSKEQWNAFGRGISGLFTSPYFWIPMGTGGGAYVASVALDDLDTVSPAQEEYKAVLDSIKEDNTRRETQRLRDSVRNANTPRYFQFSDTTLNRQMLDSVALLNLRRRSYGL